MANGDTKLYEDEDRHPGCGTCGLPFKFRRPALTAVKWQTDEDGEFMTVRCTKEDCGAPNRVPRPPRIVFKPMREM